MPIRSLGNDKEAYRSYFQLRNNEERDDYSGVMALADLFSLGTPALLDAAPDVVDIDQWMRAYAAVSLAAVSDSYFNNSNAHNARIYQRPSDGRVLLFPWDMDFAFINSATSSLTPNSDLVRLLGDPVNRRLYWGHVQDLVTRAFNAGYMRRWVEHYEDFLTGQDLTPLTDFIAQRAAYALAQVQSAIPRVSFSITSNGGNDFDSPVTPVVLEGNGWVDVRELRLAGSPVPLLATWTDANSWRVAIPLGPGANDLTLEAIDFAGELITTDTITITNTSSTVAAAAGNLALTELMYHPADPTAGELAAGFLDAEDFEFCEFRNIGTSPVDLGGVTFASGIAFTVPTGVTVAPGERVLVVRNAAAFHARYGDAPTITIAGSYQASGTAFSNSGERVHVLAADGSTIVDFTYGDSAPWPADADGSGYSLIPLAPEHTLHDPSLPINWRSSTAPGGNPGGTDATSFTTWSTNNGNVAPLDDPESDHLVALLEYATGRFPHLSESQPAVLLDPANLATFSFTLALGADDVAVTAELSTDLATWTTDGLTYAGSRNNHDGTRTITFTHDAPSPARFARMRFELRE